MRKVVGIGAGGHARVVVDIVRAQNDIQLVGLVDQDAKKRPAIDNAPILGGEDVLSGLLRQGVRNAFIGVGGVGDNGPRQQLFERIRTMGFHVIPLVHPSAIIANGVKIQEGTVVMAGVIINPGSEIGVNVILNSGSIIDHDCIVEDHVHVAPGAVLSGGVKVRQSAHIGAGATVRQGITVGARAVVGAGAVVVKDVPADVVVTGVPARSLRRS